jgi:hypothetical protein
MRDLGYETHNSLLNLGSIAIFTAFWFLKLPIVGILYMLSRKWKVFRKPFRHMFEQMFFGELISLLIDNFFVLLISGYLQITKPLKSTDGELFASYATYIGLFLTIGFLLTALIV